ncbi:MAG: pantoate--beta-alanine ligase [Cyclobacteriaceae bacterium]
MQVFQELDLVRTYVSEQKNGHSVGLVPTMGALHDGHRALLKASKQDNDVTICSIYVNPTQFNDPADLEKYPRTLKEDLELLESMDCDVVFCPSDQIMYPQAKSSVVQLDFGQLDKVLEGHYRPGHFSGVGVVVAKLLNMIQPHRAYFGQKDLQQLAIIRKLVQDFFMPVEIISVPIVREASGLALSSRNQWLSTEEKQQASQLYQALLLAKQLYDGGVKAAAARKQAVQQLDQHPDIRLEYLEAVDPISFRSVKDDGQTEAVAFCVAAYVGEVRLIDNILITGY